MSELRRADDIEPAFQQFVGKADALYVGADALAIVNRVRINTNALSARLPTVSSVGAYVEAGALIAYGANFPTCGGGPLTSSIRFKGRQASRPAGGAADKI